MDVAKGQHRVDAAGWADVGEPAGRKGAEHHPIVDLRFARQFVGKPLPCGASLAAGVVACVVGGVELAVVTQVRRKDFGVPAAARCDLDHGVVGPHAEEGECFQRVACRIARPVGRRPLRAVEGGRQVG